MLHAAARRGVWPIWFALLLSSSINAVAAEPSAESLEFPRVPAIEPADALTTFAIHPGFHLELVAAEPLVTDPVAVEFDEDGRAYVAEMRDYPYTDKSTDRPFEERTTDLPLGRIRLLEDRDRDGVYETSTIFAEELSWPTGLACYRGGVFVAATPDLWFLQDRDGDGRADVRELVVTGFRKFNVQAVINNLKWGLDHTLYAAGSSNGGALRPGDAPQAPPLTLPVADFRLFPQSREVEVVSGGARFGNCFDDWGARFLCNIRNPIQQIVMQRRHLARNPAWPARSPLWDVAQSGDTLAVFRRSPPEPWRAFRAQRWALERNQTYPRSETTGAGYFTSASGVTVYRGDAWPAEYRGQVFVADVAGNLVHREVLTRDGVVYRSQRVDDGCEFLASTDNWHRPVNFANAPDGTLWLVDMYRETIEHPWSIPDDIKAQLDLENGRDRGRLYRIAPGGYAYRAAPRLSAASDEELVALLSHANAWHRETAHRLLYERQAVAVAPLLRDLLCDTEQPLGRLHALWTLDGLNVLTYDDLQTALVDSVPQVRANAILLTEPRWTSAPQIGPLLPLADDPDPLVRFQLACTLGESRAPTATEALARIALRDAADPWIAAAIMSSAAGRAGEMLQLLCAEPASLSSEGLRLARDLAYVVGVERSAAQEKLLSDLLARLSAAELSGQLVRNALFAGLGSGLRTHGQSVANWAGEVSPTMQTLWQSAVAEAQVVAGDDSAKLEARFSAIDILSLATFAEAAESLGALLTPQTPQPLQLAAIRALSGFSAPQIAGLLLSAYEGLTYGPRGEAIEALLATPERTIALLAAIEQGAIRPSDVPPPRRKALLSSTDAALRATAERLFVAESAGARAAAVERYRESLRLSADPSRGRDVYRRECRVCHRRGDEGHDVGPNLATIVHRAPEENLLHILDPNREVGPNFQAYAVILDDGRTATGLLFAENDGSLTLRRAEGVEEVILRSQIDELTATGSSLMPDGFEQRISLQEMADLLAWLAQRP